MELNFYYLSAYFIIYAFLGWALEVSYQAVSKGKIVNRGFMNGPVCPIYGCGVTAVLVLLEPYADNLLVLYLGGFFFTSFIELVGGWVLYKAFHMRWWDYSREPYNLGGYVCLKFSLAWGICILIVVRIIQPLIEINVKFFMDMLLGKILLFIVLFGFAVDLVVTVIMVMNLNRDLRRMNAISKEIRKFSDSLTERIATQSIEGNIKLQEARVQSTLARYQGVEELQRLKEKSVEAKNSRDEELRKLKERSMQMISGREEEFVKLKEKLSAHAHFGYGRFYRAFPDLKHVQYNEELNIVIDNLKNRANRKKDKE